MSDPVIRDLVARHGHSIGSRKLAAGEVWTRLQFRSDADAAAFASILRWSAFDFVTVAYQPPAPVASNGAADVDELVKQLGAAAKQIETLQEALKSERADHDATVEKLTKADKHAAEKHGTEKHHNRHGKH